MTENHGNGNALPLNADEMRVLQEIKMWEEKPGKTHRLYQLMALPLVLKMRDLSPAVVDSIRDILRELLKTLRDYSSKTIAIEPIMNKIGIKGERTISNLAEIREVPISRLDSAARECIRFNTAAAVTEGAFSGVVGFNAFLIDIPLLYGFAFRLIEETALCYGFDTAAPEERIHILKILELGHMADEESRKTAMAELATLQAAIKSGISLNQKTMAAVTDALVRRITGVLINRKLALALMLLGGAVGAGLNYVVIKEVADAAFYCYRKRFLMERASVSDSYDL